MENEYLEMSKMRIHVGDGAADCATRDLSRVSRRNANL